MAVTVRPHPHRQEWRPWSAAPPLPRQHPTPSLWSHVDCRSCWSPTWCKDLPALPMLWTELWYELCVCVCVSCLPGCVCLCILQILLWLLCAFVHLINTLIIIMCLCASYFNYYYVEVKYRVWVCVFVHLINTLLCVFVCFICGGQICMCMLNMKRTSRDGFMQCVQLCHMWGSVLFSPFSTCSQDLLQELESGKQKDHNTWSK